MQDPQKREKKKKRPVSLQAVLIVILSAVLEAVSVLQGMYTCRAGQAVLKAVLQAVLKAVLEAVLLR